MRRTKVLLVEDHLFQREALEGYLTAQGIDVASVASAGAFRQAIERDASAPPDVVLLDVGLPGDDDGFALARWLRARTREVGIIMVTGADGLVDRVIGLESGADDYVAKPYDPRELLARIRAVQRRLPHPGPTPLSPPRDRSGSLRPSPQNPPQDGRVRVGAVTLDPGRRLLIRPDGEEDRLAPGEFELLHLLVQHPNRPLHRDWLLETTAEEGAEPDALERAIDLRIMRLRRKVERDPAHPRAIRTVRGVGYVFVPDSE